MGVFGANFPAIYITGATIALKSPDDAKRAGAVLDGIAQEGEARRRRECTRSGASFANGKRMTRSDAKAWCGPRWKPAVASA